MDQPYQTLAQLPSAGKRLFQALVLVACSLAMPAWAVDIPAPEEVTRLPAATMKKFEDQVLSKTRQPKARIKGLLDFIFEKDGLGLEYADDRSRTVARSIADRKANCLSFTLVFIELAKAANFKARLLESDQSLVWFSNDNNIYLAGHVSAQIKLGHNRFEVNFDPETPMTHSNKRPASAERIVAHYYNNRAAELMAEGDLKSAAALYDAAERMDPTLVSIYNNRGVMFRRQENIEAAAKSFERALSLDHDDLSALSNLVTVYRLQGREGEADRLASDLSIAQRKNPLHYFILGTQEEAAESYAKALDYYEQAFRLDKVEPAYLQALARVSEAMGNSEKARLYNKRANDLIKRGPRALNVVDRRPRGR